MRNNNNRKQTEERNDRLTFLYLYLFPLFPLSPSVLDVAAQHIHHRVREESERKQNDS
jgi:hypothetical protein